MTSSATEIAQTPKFKSASMNVIQGQAASLAGFRKLNEFALYIRYVYMHVICIMYISFEYAHICYICVLKKKASLTSKFSLIFNLYDYQVMDAVSH